MGEIIINRSWNFLNMARKYMIILDGKEVGRVSNSSSKTISVESGVYNLQVGIGVFSMSNKQRVEIKPNQGIEFQTQINPIMWGGLALGIIAAVCVYIGLSQDSMPILLVSIALLLTSFYLLIKYSILLKQIAVYDIIYDEIV